MSHTTKKEQKMVCLLVMQEETMTTMKASLEEMKVRREKTENSLGTTEARMESGYERLEADIKPGVEDMGATDFEANPEEVETMA
jgi:hypothetical protein